MTHPTNAPMQAVFLLVPHYPSQGEDNPGTWDWSSLVGDDDVRHLHPLEVLEEIREYLFKVEVPIDNTDAVQEAYLAVSRAHHWMQEAGLTPDE